MAALPGRATIAVHAVAAVVVVILPAVVGRWSAAAALSDRCLPLMEEQLRLLLRGINAGRCILWVGMNAVRALDGKHET